MQRCVPNNITHKNKKAEKQTEEKREKNGLQHVDDTWVGNEELEHREKDEEQGEDDSAAGKTRHKECH